MPHLRHINSVKETSEMDDRKYLRKKKLTKGMQLKPKLWRLHKMKLPIELHEREKFYFFIFFYLKLYLQTTKMYTKIARNVINYKKREEFIFQVNIF